MPSTLILNGEEAPPANLTEEIWMPLLFLFMILMNWEVEPVEVNTVSKWSVSTDVLKREDELLVNDSFLQAHKKKIAGMINRPGIDFIRVKNSN